jgi:hypothetical protein
MRKNIKKPNFFIIGAPKCGTTSLSKYLREHPNIFFSDPKEPGYFCTDFFKKSRYVFTEKRYLEKYFKGAAGYKRVGEGSTAYLYSKDAVKNILRFNPEAKFIVMIRNPINMFKSLHSQLLFDLNENIKDPRKAWELQKERIKGKHIPPFSLEPKFLQYGEFCKLGEQIERLLKIVPNKKNIKIIRFERFKNNTKEVYEEVLKFLDLKTDNRKEFPIYNRNSRPRSKFLVRVIRILMESSLQKYSRVLKEKIGIISWSRFFYLNKINNKIIKIKHLDKGFRIELKKYFEEDQELLNKILKNKD